MENPPVEETLKYRVYKFFDHFVDFGEAVLAFPLLQWTLYLVSQESYWTLGRPSVCILPRGPEGKRKRRNLVDLLFCLGWVGWRSQV